MDRPLRKTSGVVNKYCPSVSDIDCLPVAEEVLSYSFHHHLYICFKLVSLRSIAASS